MKRWGRILLGGAGGLGAWLLVSQVMGFGRAEAYVECQISLAGHSCTVTHRAGREAAKVCWDVVATCNNGTVATGSGCATVAPDAKTMTVIPWAEVKNWGSCDAVRSLAILNQKVEIQ